MKNQGGEEIKGDENNQSFSRMENETEEGGDGKDRDEEGRLFTLMSDKDEDKMDSNLNT